MLKLKLGTWFGLGSWPTSLLLLLGLEPVELRSSYHPPDARVEAFLLALTFPSVGADWVGAWTMRAMDEVVMVRHSHTGVVVTCFGRPFPSSTLAGVWRLPAG